MPMTLLRPAVELLGRYARRHRDQRNIVTHFVGVPMSVFGLAVLLGRPSWAGGLSPAWCLWAASSLWYLSRGQFALGLLTSGLTFVLVALAAPLAAGSTALWLCSALTAFAVGWAFQLAGHYYEGRRLAAADDAAGLLVGPLFIVAEWLFHLGHLGALRQEVERLAGPTHLRDLTLPTA